MSSTLRFKIIASICALGWAVSACSNRGAVVSKPMKAVTGVASESPNVGDGTNGFFVLSQVLASNTDPATTLDLIGDGSRQFGQFCVASGDTTQTSSAPTPGASPAPAAQTSSSGGASSNNCRCVYKYAKPGGNIEQFESAVIYSESDLIRCKRTSIPSGVSKVEISIKLVAQDAQSNPVTFNLSYGISNLDLAQSTSYQLINRFQCKDTVIAPYLLDDSIYDPILSEDASLSYPLNYYTNNMGNSFAVYTTNPDAAAAGGVGYFCPAKPNDANAGMDLRLFSIQSDGASKLIYPPQGSVTDRSTFYLAKKSTGVFNVPVNAYLAPNSITSAPGEDGKPSGGAALSIGFGARPSSTGDGTEDCPGSDVAIPTGYKWVKLWSFRASIADRKVPGSAKIKSIGYIACNPNPTSTFVAVTGCGATYGTRLIASGQCYTAAHTAAGLNGGLTQWTSVGGSGNGLPDHVNGAAIASSEIQYVSLDKGVSRYDFVFVVTPPSVQTRHFKNATPESLPYTPYRYMTPTDCPVGASDPDTDATCIANAAKIIRYGMKAYDVGSNGDAPKDDPGRQPVFPVCALQPI